MSTTADSALIVRPTEGESFRIGGLVLTIKIPGRATGGAYTLIEKIYPPIGNPWRCAVCR